jgi:PBP1b-binding outer membrane lipoprotein LpoB
MKNIMILTLLLIFTVGCKSECVEEAPVKDVHEMTDEEIKETVF